MHFHGPETADLRNVELLNGAFLDLVRRGELAAGATAAAGAAESYSAVAALLALPADDAARLARCPFLLFSLAEADEARWRALFDAGFETDLVDRMQQADGGLASLTVSSLGFLWELARRNPYAVRLVTGAPLNWCEQLAATPPLMVFRFARRGPLLLGLRQPRNARFWKKLIESGTSKEREVRRAAQLCALQRMLTRPQAGHYRSLRSAACAMPASPMRVADNRARDSRRRN